MGKGKGKTAFPAVKNIQIKVKSYTHPMRKSHTTPYLPLSPSRTRPSGVMPARLTFTLVSRPLL